VIKLSKNNNNSKKVFLRNLKSTPIIKINVVNILMERKNDIFHTKFFDVWIPVLMSAFLKNHHRCLRQENILKIQQQYKNVYSQNEY